jgi:CheY-like chemotaxis protein
MLQANSYGRGGLIYQALKYRYTKTMNKLLSTKEKLTILLAEDDIDDQELLADAFKEINPEIKLVAFSTGRRFLSYTKELKASEIPDLIILDYNIPEINGAEILKLLDEDVRFHSVAKLVWSTSNSPQYEISCKSLGAKAYLVKPSDISGLIELAKKMIELVN